MVYAITVALSGLLVRWWAGILVAALYGPFFGVAQRVEPDLVINAEALAGPMLLLLAGLVALYARALERALETSTQQTRELQRARTALQEVVAVQEAQIARAGEIAHRLREQSYQHP